MQSISGIISGAAQSSASVVGVKEPPKVQRTEDEAQRCSLKPAMDEYIPEEKQEPTGRYWLGKGEDDKPKIYFDDPEQVVGYPEKPDEFLSTEASEKDRAAKGPNKKATGDKEESCTCNTDKVDREIEKLKKKKEELEQQLNSETDDRKIQNLEKELVQVESELRQKNNDTYRRQHATYTYF